MASIIDIKRRKASVESTGQITKAMKLVSTVKLQRAKQRADESKAYFNKMYETISSILAKAGNINHPYLQENGSTKKGIITISSNRGLAGGYNNNIVKLIRDSGMNKEDIMILLLYPPANPRLDEMVMIPFFVEPFSCKYG